MRLLISLLFPIAVIAQTGALAPQPIQQPLSNNGLILSGACMYTYAAGSTTPAITYSDALLTTPNTNPLLLDSFGRMPPTFLAAISYKFVFGQRSLGVCPLSPGTVIWSQDNVYDFGELLKAALALPTGAASIGFQPTNGSVPITVAAALNTTLLDPGYTSLPSACSAAHNTGRTLVVTRAWALQPTETLTCDKEFVAGGSIQPAGSGCTGFCVVTLAGAITAPPVQIFDTSLAGAGSIQLTGPLAGGAVAAWFGADLTGALDPIAPLNAAYASGASLIHLTNGIYNLQSAGWIMSKTGVAVACDTGAKLKYTGSSTIDSVAFVGSASTFIYNQQFSGCLVVGNSHSTYALHTEKTNHSTFSNLDLKDAATSSLYIDSDVAVLFDSVTVSSATGEFTYKPINGIEVNGSNAIFVVVPVIELGITSGSGSPTRGIYLHGGATAIYLASGTTEQNDVNLYMAIDAQDTQVIGMDDEAPCTANIVDAGLNNAVSGGLIAGLSGVGGCSTTPPSVHYLATAAQGRTVGITGDQIVIDSGAKSIRVESNTLGNNFGSVTTDILDSGTMTYSLANRQCCGGNLILQTWKGAMFLGTPGGGNSDVAILGQSRLQFTSNNSGECSGTGTGCSGASANNLLIANLLYPDGSLVPVAAGLEVKIFSGHSLQAGGPNTLNLNNTGALPIVRDSDGGDITVPFTGGGRILDLYNTGAAWIALGLQ